MTRITTSMTLEHTLDNIFNIVRDIEKYPLFIPGCKSSLLIETKELDSNTQCDIASLSFAPHLFNINFTTKNAIFKHQIRMELIAGSFKNLNGTWNFTPLNANQTQIEIAIQFEFKSKLLSLTVTPIIQKSISKIVNIFCARADYLYPTRERCN